MAVIRVTKEFRFDMAHALYNYNGKCSFLHGHTFKLFVTVRGEKTNDPGAPRDGMVMDFGDLKRIVNQEIIQRYDHAMLVNRKSGASDAGLQHSMFEKLIYFPVQPSTENLLLDFKTRIQPRLPAGIHLHSIRLHETPNSFAEWYAADNPGE